VLDAQLPPSLVAVFRDDVVLVLLVARIDVHRDQRKVDRRPLPQVVERLHQRPAVLAARETHHHAVAVFNQIEVDDRLRGLFRDAGLKSASLGH
jgi:hypothetical protein